jgi:phenylpropionate dioxygenase-like ring-hydroxylating dioxygenase large terminal subunit
MTIDLNQLTPAEADLIEPFPKPETGSWTRSFGMDMTPVDMSDHFDPEFYELEKEAVFKRSWLHMGRVEKLPRKGSYFTRELEFLNLSIVIVRGMDDEIRAFHNICSHRGNQLVWDEVPQQEVQGMCRQFTCKYHGWRYDLEGNVGYVHNAPEFEFGGIDPDRLKLPEIHCDVWAGFVFVNLAKEPPQSLREFIGPDLVGLEQYPFHKLTERHRLEAEVGSNWKLFMDAFAEFYHVPYVHASINNPQGNGVFGGDKPPFMIPWFQPFGKHRMMSSGGQYANKKGRGVLPSQEIFRGALYGAHEAPDIGERGPVSNPGRLEKWGMDTWQLYPNLVIMTWSQNHYLVYEYWPISVDRHKFIMDFFFVPPTKASERLTQEMIVVISKDFALQDANVLEATQRRITSGARTEFFYNDQEVLLRHLHEVVRGDVDDYKRELEKTER